MPKTKKPNKLIYPYVSNIWITALYSMAITPTHYNGILRVVHASDTRNSMENLASLRTFDSSPSLLYQTWAA
ncbi:hypothetical protein DNHGIG_03910 [Collibacillus ludicampi]|uniref:Uncharacterized protein n=1 Tax=Collibacillus ludicampi TaxID=2771369 RepID=A0AAV4LAJ8_9BACL|nr:hypothetical protein DNHGIG_03910 [Collibacillus ludicampi]